LLNYPEEVFIKKFLKSKKKMFKASPAISSG